MAKTTDMFGSMKFWFKPKLTYAAGRESMIELLVLVSDFMVNSRLKILKGISVEFIERHNEGV